jgi:hypothetical protein
MKIRFASALVAAAAIATAAQAGELRPMQAGSIAMGEVTGVAYYTVTAEGYEVVATLAAGEDGTPMRFQATLTPGQRVFLSVPRGANERPFEVEIARLGDTMVMSEPARELSAVLD